RAFVDEWLIPNEELAERNGGRLPENIRGGIVAASIAAGLNGGRHSRKYGGQDWSTTEWFLVQEQYGRSTNALHWWVPDGYNVLEAGSPEQIERYLVPSLDGRMIISYAVTEEHAGSDPSEISATATRAGDGWLLNAEKWFVTSGDVAAAHIVVANALDGTQRLPTLFIVDADNPGIEVVDEPLFTHTYPHGHPTLRFTDVRVSDDAVLGGVGAADELQRAWFVEERLAIAARCVGAMWRLLAEATGWAIQRRQGGQRIFDYQGVSFPLADSAADAAAGRLLGLEVARLTDTGADPKLVHAKASMAKLFCSEAAYRCADRAVQIFGGRGYTRTNVAERLLRELRVDRIWEGTSEIQRLIIARALERRGVAPTIH
ncbi:MAG TPA: acyl-CoA dehydrogenase family protein, partial [Actinomycetes bacterium]|nr:acyl-CoA dehydrogenase family protein [Actinomycetes bacterium]